MGLLKQAFARKEKYFLSTENLKLNLFESFFLIPLFVCDRVVVRSSFFLRILCSMRKCHLSDFDYLAFLNRVQIILIPSVGLTQKIDLIEEKLSFVLRAAGEMEVLTEGEFHEVLAFAEFFFV